MVVPRGTSTLGGQKPPSSIVILTVLLALLALSACFERSSDVVVAGSNGDLGYHLLSLLSGASAGRSTSKVSKAVAEGKMREAMLHFHAPARGKVAVAT